MFKSPGDAWALGGTIGLVEVSYFTLGAVISADMDLISQWQPNTPSPSNVLRWTRRWRHAPPASKRGWINWRVVRERVNEIADQVELPHEYCAKYVSQLSGGNQQKVLSGKPSGVPRPNPQPMPLSSEPIRGRCGRGQRRRPHRRTGWNDRSWAFRLASRDDCLVSALPVKLSPPPEPESSVSDAQKESRPGSNLAAHLARRVPPALRLSGVAHSGAIRGVRLGHSGLLIPTASVPGSVWPWCHDCLSKKTFAKDAFRSHLGQR